MITRRSLLTSSPLFALAPTVPALLARAAAGERVKGPVADGSLNRVVVALAALGLVALGVWTGGLGSTVLAAPPGKPEKLEGASVSGRVLGPEGKPLAGAGLFLVGPGGAPKKLGVSGPDGRFTVTAPRGQRRVQLVARADGVGIDFVDLGLPGLTEEVELRVVKDRPVRGRVVDTQGKPRAGVTVEATSVEVYGNTLDPFLAAWKTGSPHFQFPYGTKSLFVSDGVLAPATTDADGRFTVKGVGDERLAQLRVRGPGIATEEVWVVNRAGFDPTPYNRLTDDKIAQSGGSGQKELLFGPDPAVVVEAEKPVRGVVTDKDTGRPRAGVTVTLEGSGQDRVATAATPQLSARTDSEGRYEIRGARKAKAYAVKVPEDATGGYLATKVRAEDTPGYTPVTLNVGVKKGVVVTGRMIDKSTGKSLPGFATVAVLHDNKFGKDYPEFDPLRFQRATGADGTFRLVSIPGPVLLMGGPDTRRMPDGIVGRFKYKPPAPDPKYPRYFSTESPFGPGYYSIGGGTGILRGNSAKVLELKPGTDPVTCDIEVEPATALPVKIRDAEGKPVTGTWVTGLGPQEWEPPVEVKGDTCAAYHLEGKPRLMVFYEPTKKLFGSLALKGDEKEPVSVKLGPGGAVTGRLVGEDGKPLPGVAVRLRHRDRQAEGVHAHVHRARPVETDAEGKFRIDDVVPGVEFELSFTRGKVRFEPVAEPASRTVESAKTTDVGALKRKPQPAP